MVCSCLGGRAVTKCSICVLSKRPWEFARGTHDEGHLLWFDQQGFGNAVLTIVNEVVGYDEVNTNPEVVRASVKPALIFFRQAVNTLLHHEDPLMRERVNSPDGVLIELALPLPSHTLVGDMLELELAFD